MCISTIQTENGIQRKCSKCKKFKPLDEFYKHKNKPSGRSYTCKKCTREYMKEVRKNLKETLTEGDERHGTFYGYTLGCRCDKCREASNLHMREYRKRKNGNQD